jgi:hypothetical protein
MQRLLLAEFQTPEALAAAIRGLRERGFRRLDAHTPYSTEVVREALALPESRLARRVFAGGMFGATAAYALEWYLNAVSYPLNVGGRPAHMPLAFVPIAFEMGILFAAFTAVFSVFQQAKLARLWDPVFEAEGIESASVDRFWLRVDGDDPLFDQVGTPELVARFQPSRQVVLEGAAP